jgi:integrase
LDAVCSVGVRYGGVVRVCRTYAEGADLSPQTVRHRDVATVIGSSREHSHRTHPSRGRRADGSGETGAAIRKIHFLISGAYRRAVRWGWIDRNPAATAAPPCVPHPEPQPPAPAEAARILTGAWADPDLGPLVWLAMATGARRGELCALRWRHVDLTRRVLVIRTSIARSGSETYEKDPKLHQRRHIALDLRTTAMLTAYQQARRHRAARAGATLTDEGFVFSSCADVTTCPVPDALSRQYHHLVTDLGVRTTLHKLRHYSATELITAGVDLRTVAGRLGHADNGRTTLRYYTAWVNEADQRASHTLMHHLPTPHTPRHLACAQYPVSTT